MLVANFTSRIPNMGDTKTYEDWSKYLGTKPHRLGVVARMYTDNTLNFITDGLRNVFYKGERASAYELSRERELVLMNFHLLQYLNGKQKLTTLKRLSLLKFQLRLAKMEQRLQWHSRRTITRSMTSSELMLQNSNVKLLAVLFVSAMTTGKFK